MRWIVLAVLLVATAAAEHPSQDNLASTRADELDLRADGIVVAVLDSGINTHPDLPEPWRNDEEVPGNLLDDDLNGYADDVYGWDTCDDAPATDGHGTWHGTAVAGVIAAEGHVQGVAPGVRIMHVRVLCGVDWGDPRHPVDLDALQEGIRYAVDNGAHIIVMSLQSWSDTTQTIPALLEAEDAFTYAHDAGVLLVAAAGNFGNTAPSSPGNMPHVFTVSATRSCDWIAPYSNHGGDIWAPGSAWSTVPGGHDIVHGTSFAAPLVAGVAALVLAEDSAATPDELVERIMGAARTQDAGKPFLDAAAIFGVPYTPRTGSLDHPSSLKVGDRHTLHLGYVPDDPAPPYVVLDVEGDDRYCYPTSRMQDETFTFHMAGLRSAQPVTAALFDGRTYSGNTSFVLHHTPGTTTATNPLLGAVADETVATPAAWVAPVLLAIAWRRR